MSNFTYLKASDNLIGQALLTPDNEDANFLASNVAVLPISQLFKTGEGNIGDQKLRIDFPVAQSIDTIVLVNHNLTSGATITVNGGSSPDPDGSEFTTTITWSSKLAWKVLSASESWAYWSITIDDEANLNGFLSIGYILIGLSTALSVGQRIGWQVGRGKVVRQLENEIGVPMVGAKIADGAVITLSFEGLTDAEKSELDTFLDSLDREVDPLFFSPDTSEAEAFFGRLSGDYSMVRQFPGVTDISGLPFATDSFGNLVSPTVPFHYTV